MSAEAWPRCWPKRLLLVDDEGLEERGRPMCPKDGAEFQLRFAFRTPPPCLGPGKARDTCTPWKAADDTASDESTQCSPRAGSPQLLSGGAGIERGHTTCLEDRSASRGPSPCISAHRARKTCTAWADVVDDASSHESTQCSPLCVGSVALVRCEDSAIGASTAFPVWVRPSLILVVVMAAVLPVASQPSVAAVGDRAVSEVDQASSKACGSQSLGDVERAVSSEEMAAPAGSQRKPTRRGRRGRKCRRGQAVREGEDDHDDDDEDIEDVPPPHAPFAAGPEELPAGCPTLGSLNHPHACADFCKYSKKSRGCMDGAACIRCHLCTSKRLCAAPSVRRATYFVTASQ